LSPEQWSHRQRERIIRLAGNPAEFGVPEPDPDLRVAGVSLCQDYLAKARDKCITCRPAITGIAGNSVTFADGTTDRFGAIICATGYELHMPYLDPELRSALGIAPALYQRTFHPDLPGLGVIGQFLAQGPYFPLLELQARWIIAVWTGEVKLPDERAMCSTIAEGQPSLDAHNALAGIASRARGSSRSRSSRRLRTPARPICHIGRSRLVIGAVTMTNGGTAMLEKIFYTSVLVSDQDKALDFYTNVLGLEKRVENPTPDGPRFITVGVPGDDFQLVLWPGTPGQAQPAMGRPPASITIETDDCRKSVDELKSRGVEFVSDVLEFPWGYVAQFQDPDGNRLQLREGR
jgi:predicted enzyme related to lactoylglutathione lyase